MIDYEDCVAFYLGELSPREARSVALWLHAHPEMARRAGRDAEVQKQIKRHFDPVLDEPIPQRLLAAGARRPRWPKRMATAAVVVLAAAGGWWFGTTQVNNSTAVPAFRQRVAVLSQQQPQHVSQARSAQAASINAPDLSAHGYRLVASRVLHQGDRPMTAFLYRNNAGGQIRIYAQTRPQRVQAAPSVLTQNGVQLAQWHRDGVNYALVGNNVPSGSLRSLARAAAGAPVQSAQRQSSGVKSVAHTAQSGASAGPSQSNPRVITLQE